MGEPNATEIPDAAAADKTSLLRAINGSAWILRRERLIEECTPSLSLIVLKNLMKILAQQHAT